MQALLARAGAYEPEYGAAGLTSHLPMALVALDRLGATRERCQDYIGWYAGARKLAPLNLHGEFALAAKGIAESLQRRGREATLKALLAQLMDSVGSQAFHGMIRTAYALEAQDDSELAFALAYWQSAPMRLPIGEADAASSLSLEEAFRAAEKLFAPYRGCFRGQLISSVMSKVAEWPAFQQLASALPASECAPDRLAAVSLALFAATGDFTALHAVTGTHAFRVVSGFLDNSASAGKSLAVALLAAYADMDAPPLPSANALDAWRNSAAPEWDVLATRAVASNDDHVIKVTYSAREEDALWPDPLYRVAAYRYQHDVQREQRQLA